METLGTGRPLEIGVPAPDFTLTMMDTARPVSLADYRGKTPLPLVCTEDSIVRSVDARSRHLARSPTAFGPSVSKRLPSSLPRWTMRAFTIDIIPPAWRSPLTPPSLLIERMDYRRLREPGRS